jgi:hypothetical protein
VLGTAQLRAVWGPACRPRLVSLRLHGGGIVPVDRRTGDAVRALNTCLIVWGYRTRASQTGAYNCRVITGGSGYSLHAFAIALDLNWLVNLYSRRLVTNMSLAMTSAITSIRTNNGKQVWGWGGNYSRVKDAMHFEIVCSPADLATGIRWSTVPGRRPTPVPPAPVPRRFLPMLNDKEQQELLDKERANHLLLTAINTQIQNHLAWPANVPGPKRHAARNMMKWTMEKVDDALARIKKIEEKVNA